MACRNEHDNENDHRNDRKNKKEYKDEEYILQEDNNNEYEEYDKIDPNELADIMHGINQPMNENQIMDEQENNLIDVKHEDKTGDEQNEEEAKDHNNHDEENKGQAKETEETNQLEQPPAEWLRRSQ